jgi:hypothetical protein
MPGMESMVATTSLDAMVGAQGLAVVKSIVIWLMAIERMRPKSTYTLDIYVFHQQECIG